MNPTATCTLTDLSVRGEQGSVFGPITCESRSPITVITGARGSGRTSLLLSITGRMHTDTGTVTTLGHTRPKHIRAVTGVAGFDAIDALEPQVTVAAIIRERLGWILPWYRRAPRVTQELAVDLMGHRLTPPDVTMLVRDLSEAQELLLRVGLASLEDPTLIAVDDLDRIKHPQERAHAITQLAALAQSGVRLVIATSDAGDLEQFASHTGTAPTQISL